MQLYLVTWLLFCSVENLMSYGNLPLIYLYYIFLIIDLCEEELVLGYFSLAYCPGTYFCNV